MYINCKKTVLVKPKEMKMIKLIKTQVKNYLVDENYPSNNWRKMHRLPLVRLVAARGRKRNTLHDTVCVPFPETSSKKIRFKK